MGTASRCRCDRPAHGRCDAAELVPVLDADDPLERTARGNEQGLTLAAAQVHEYAVRRELARVQEVPQRPHAGRQVGYAGTPGRAGVEEGVQFDATARIGPVSEVEQPVLNQVEALLDRPPDVVVTEAAPQAVKKLHCRPQSDAALFRTYRSWVAGYAVHRTRRGRMVLPAISCPSCPA